MVQCFLRVTRASCGLRPFRSLKESGGSPNIRRNDDHIAYFVEFHRG